VTEPFLTAFWVSLWAGVLLALPIILWQVWGFFAPAFEKGMQRKVVGFALFAAFLMAAGIAFGYFIVLDPAVHFLTNYDHNQFDFKPRAKSYYSFVTLIMVATAIVFELPVFILAMARIGILPADRLRRNRRMGYVIVAAVAVALPGVDPVTTTLEMIPLMILFEASIWLAVFFDRRWKRDAQAREASWQAEYGDFGDFDTI
jgi:sec-independent protein translocase protein TatC